MDDRFTILVVDDENGVRQSFYILLKDLYKVVLAGSGEEALALFASHRIDLILLDIRLPDVNGIDLLARFKALDPQIEVVMITAVNDVQTAVKSIKSGAYEYIGKPFNVDEILAVIVRALEKRQLVRQVRYLKGELARHHLFEKMVGKHPTMKKLFSQIEAVSATDATVLLQGESGTGKELVARAIHNLSPRGDYPFAVVNCAAIPATLMESELFGHLRGAFTGAHTSRAGKLETADRGSVFLDDIDSLDLVMQAKLLRIIQEREYQRLGSTQVLRADVRFIAASNKDLHHLVGKGLFRQDLFYRLNVFPIILPPLRARRSDIPLLLNHFLSLQAKKNGRPPQTISPRAIQMLTNHHWPGNVRELENAVERMVTIAPGQVLLPEHLPPLEVSEPDANGLTLKDAVSGFERKIITDTLASVGGSRKLAAAKLGIHRNTLLAKIGEAEAKK